MCPHHRHPLAFGLAVAVILALGRHRPAVPFQRSWQLTVQLPPPPSFNFPDDIPDSKCPEPDLAAVQLKLAELIRSDRVRP